MTGFKKTIREIEKPSDELDTVGIEPSGFSEGTPANSNPTQINKNPDFHESDPIHARKLPGEEK